MSDETSSPAREYQPITEDTTEQLEVMATASPPPEAQVRDDREESVEVAILDDPRYDKEVSRTHEQRSPKEPVRHQPIRQSVSQSLQRHVQSSFQRPALPNQRPMHLPITSSPERIRKKPGPKPWSTKPLMKNDMAAKKELIAEIESYWGKGFIKAFIPKCHRPLVKRGKGGKRSAFRQSENDPKKWMPSVLKAVLMIAKKTADKKWLKEQMRDVVTYRIKHTGNRKPQLVTTDFDVIEDVFDSGWTVAQSFTIRYKHLLMNRGDNVETDEDIAHIFGEGPRGEESGEDGEDDEGGEDDDEVEYGEDGEMGDDRSEDGAEQELSNGYYQVSGYIQTPQYPLPEKPKQSYGQPHPGVGRPMQQQQGGTVRRPPPPPQVFAQPARPRPRPPQTPQQFTPSPSSYAESEDRTLTTSGNKHQRSPAPYGFGENKRGRTSLLSTPSHHMSRMHVQPPPPPAQYPVQQSPRGPKIKTEPGLDDAFDGPENELGPPYMEQQYAVYETEEDQNMRLELEEAEAHARVATLRVQINKKKNMGSTPGNPMNLE